jgi:hypothetical protein
MDKKYKYRPSFALSIFLSLFVLLVSFGGGMVEVYESPWTWLAIGCAVALPVVWATSKLLLVTEEGLCFVDLWGLVRRRIAWTDIEEVEQLKTPTTEGGLYGALKPFAAATWLADRYHAPDLKIFLWDESPLHLRTGSWRGGTEVLAIIGRKVKVARR